MPAVTLTDASISIGGVAAATLSPQVVSITLNYKAEALDDTAMGATTRSATGGLKAWDGTAEIHWNATIDATIFAAIGQTFTFTGKRSSGANSASNPQFSGVALLTDCQPLAGTVGEVQKGTLTFQSAGTLSRATS